jgi:hypothetical protein
MQAESGQSYLLWSGLLSIGVRHMYLREGVWWLGGRSHREAVRELGVGIVRRTSLSIFRFSLSALLRFSLFRGSGVLNTQATDQRKGLKTAGTGSVVQHRMAFLCPPCSDFRHSWRFCAF